MLVQRAATRHSYTPLKIAILSGLSDPSTCALSEIQRDFLARLDAPESAKIYRNFPYVDSAPPRRPPPLWLASWRNTQQFLGASNPATIARARPHWRALCDSTDALLVITLSCGLEILRHCVDADDAHRSIHVLALGPVARAVPPLPCTLVQGRRDPITRAFFTAPSNGAATRITRVALPDVGHLHYLENNAVLNLANELLCGNTLKSSAAVSISHSAS